MRTDHALGGTALALLLTTATTHADTGRPVDLIFGSEGSDTLGAPFDDMLLDADDLIAGSGECPDVLDGGQTTPAPASTARRDLARHNLPPLPLDPTAPPAGPVVCVWRPAQPDHWHCDFDPPPELLAAMPTAGGDND